MRVWTIGFTKTSAERFFEQLKSSGATHVVDVRLHNVSQLAGFAKRDDLSYFLRTICGMGYVHEPRLAPTTEMLDDYRKKRSTWDEYEGQFLALLSARSIESNVSHDTIAGGVLLCSEDKPERCHRRLVAEYLSRQWGDVEITHLT
ncbi:MAG: DUF488 domain-containing protein [Dehalococcoidia bacterium]